MNVSNYGKQINAGFNWLAEIATILNETGTVVFGVEPTGICCVYVPKYGFE